MNTQINAETQTQSKYTAVDMSELKDSKCEKVNELFKFFEANRENLKYSKHGYREKLRTAFQEQSGLSISDGSFRQCLSFFRKTHNCPLEISTPHYLSQKKTKA